MGWGTLAPPGVLPKCILSMKSWGSSWTRNASKSHALIVCSNAGQVDSEWQAFDWAILKHEMTTINVHWPLHAMVDIL